MASSPITSWQIEGGKVEAVTDSLFFGSKIDADGQHSHEISRRLLLGRKVMTNLHTVFNSKDITLLTKVCIVMYGCESWTINKADLWRIDVFELWCWRRLLRAPQIVRRSNQLNFKEINPEYSLEGLILKLRLQHWPPDAASWHIAKDPDAEKDWRQKEKRATEDEMVGWHHWFIAHELG